MRKILFSLFLILIIIGIGGYLFRGYLTRSFFSPRNSNVKLGISKSDLKISPIPTGAIPSISQQEDIKIIAQDLKIPWEIVFLPNGDRLVTERPGTLLKIDSSKQVVQKIQGVQSVGEGGLLGMAIHPDFKNNQWLYLYLTFRSGQDVENRVERYKFDGEKLSDQELILSGIAAAQYHDGGRIAFGPDGKLYITTGDAQNGSSAQDTNSLNGKILRINDDGSIPGDNPFGNAVWTYGHRNPEGLAWDDQGRLWETEHGPSGSQSGYDELNLIEKGKNYGWPVIQGDQTKEGMVSPVIQSGSSDTWAPAGAVYYNGSIFFAGLRGSALYEAKLDGTKVTQLIAHFKNDYGRLRAVVLSPDNLMNVSTSNTDGRGTPKPGDDKILSIKPSIFFQ